MSMLGWMAVILVNIRQISIIQFFLRYFTATFVEEDQALYLDCDIVVTRDLSEIFAVDLGSYPLGAVRDLGGEVYFGEQIF